MPLSPMRYLSVLRLQSATRDAYTILAARATRAFGDGYAAILLPLHLDRLGFSALAIGAIAAATLLGSALITLAIGLIAYRFHLRSLLVRASLLMIFTGVGFAFARDFWPLLAIAFVGTLNPTSGDVSIFVPLEQTLLPHTVEARQRTDLFARYSMIGAFVVAIGALAAGIPDLVEKRGSYSFDQALQGMFLLYAMLGVVTLSLYARLTPDSAPSGQQSTTPLAESRSVIYRLTALFSLDAFAGGFVVNSMLALWLFERFDLSASTAGAIFFTASTLSGISHLISARMASRIGLVNTMVFTHLPANLFLIAAAFMPTVELAVACLLGRFALSQMDIPARTSYVISVVSPAERPAAASITNVPRSLAAALGPFISGFLLGLSTFGWPLIIAGSLKAVYDLALLRMFRNVPPRSE